jgi:hypothetical protein
VASLAKAEYWLAELIDWINKAQWSGTVPQDVLDKPTTCSTTPPCIGNGGLPRTLPASTIRMLRVNR